MTTLQARESSTRLESLLDGLARRVEAADASRQREITDAMTGRPLGHVPHCSAEDVAAAARRGREVQAQWAARPVSERAEVLLRFHDLVLAHRRRCST